MRKMAVARIQAGYLYGSIILGRFQMVKLMIEIRVPDSHGDARKALNEIPHHPVLRDDAA